MIKFGTGGWRAIIGDEFIKSNIQLVAQAVAILMKEDGQNNHAVLEKGIILGYDRRFLSDMAAKWIAEVMAGNDIPVKLINKISPTPLIMYTSKEYENHYSMAVTASHNPAAYNGIKLFTFGGRDATEDITIRVEQIISTLKQTDINTLPYDLGLKKQKSLLQNITSLLKS